MNAPSNKAEALILIDELIQKFDISSKSITALQKKSAPLDKKDNKWITYLLGYLGASFIFGGLVLLISMMWVDLNSLARVIITYGSGLSAFIMGYIFTKDERYTRLSLPFHLIAAFLLPIGMFTFLKEYSTGNDIQLACIIIFSILSVQFFISFWKLNKTSLLFLAYFFFNSALVPFLERIELPYEYIGLSVGTSMMIFSYYFNTTKHNAITPIWFIAGYIFYLLSASSIMDNQYISNEWNSLVISTSLLILGYHFTKTKYKYITPAIFFIGSCYFFFSLYNLIESKQGIDLIFLCVAIISMFISVQIKSRTLLTVSTIALIGFLGYFTDEYFADVTGWPIALIVLGFFLIGISHYALKLGKKIG